VYNIDLTLTKLMVTGNSAQIAALSADLWREASFAKANLGQLPLSNSQLDNTANFLSQVGDYTYSLSKKINNGASVPNTLVPNLLVSDQETAQLESLLTFSAGLSDELQSMQDKLLSGQLSLAQNTGALASAFAGTADTFESGIGDVEKKFSDYVSMTYDGPFSEHNMNKKSKMLEAQPEISAETAIKIARDCIPAENRKTVALVGEEPGNMPTYACKATGSDSPREITVQVTKRGGHVRLVIDSRNVLGAKLSIEDAAVAADEFLQGKGMDGMVRTGYILSGSCVDFAYAYKNGDYILYPELIKVKIALDNGEMVGYEANSYLISHDESRVLPQNIKSVDEAKEQIKKNMNILGARKCLIPLDTGEDAFCYEFQVSYREKTFLIYINIENLREEKILMMVESDKGSLTI
jgi:germination protein YpeB